MDRSPAFVRRLRLAALLIVCGAATFGLARLAANRAAGRPGPRARPAEFLPTPGEESVIPPAEPYAAVDPALVAALNVMNGDALSAAALAGLPPLGAYLSGQANAALPTLTPVPSPTRTPSPTATRTASASRTPRPSSTTTRTVPTGSQSATPSATRTALTTATATATATATPTASITLTPSRTPIPTLTATPTITASPTLTPILPPPTFTPIVRNTGEAPRRVPGLYTLPLGYGGYNCAPAGWPADGVLTQYFHYWHRGIDIGVPLRTPVHATHSGQVLFAGWRTDGYGNLIILENGPFQTYYGHLTDFNVVEGQFVARGQIIGWSGSTGNSSGPHIHYETRIDGVEVDPLTFEKRGFPPC